MTHLDDEDTPTSPGAAPHLGRPSMTRRSPEEAQQLTHRLLDRLHLHAAWALLALTLCGAALLHYAGVL